MIYEIWTGTRQNQDSLLHDGANDDRLIIDPVLTLEAGKAGSLKFTIMPTHEYYGSLKKLESYVSVYRDGVRVFIGRMIDDSLDYRNFRTVLVEGLLAVFNDSVIRPYEYSGSVEGYLQLLLDQHNLQVESDKQVLLGEVTVLDNNDYITRSDSSYPSTWSIMQSKLADSLGGFFSVRVNSNNELLLDYLADSPYVSGQEIVFGENLLDVKQNRKASEICTAIIPLGVKDEETGTRLTVESVNGGSDIVYHEQAVAQYGTIVRTETWDNVTLPENLLLRARQYLANQILTEVSINITAVDLSIIDSTVDKFKIFEYVKVVSDRHELDDHYLILKQVINIGNPSKDQMTLGTVFRTFADDKVSQDDAIREIKSEYTTNKQVNLIKESMQSYVSLIEQTAEMIRLEVSEAYVTADALEQLSVELRTQLEQDSESFTFRFTEIQETLDLLDEDTRTRLEMIESYVRIEGSNIVIGRSDSDLSTVITNEKMSFFDGGVEVAYISGQEMVINSARIVEATLANHVMKKLDNNITIFYWAN